MNLLELLESLGSMEERLPGPGFQLDRATAPEGTAVVELAGRDSVAAALASPPLTAALPTFVYTGTEYGDPAVLLHNLVLLRNRLAGSTELLEPLVLGSPRWWAALCGRYATPLFRRYGFSFTCVGCHMYLHAVRVLLAARLGLKTVIAGEREKHGKRVKINQVPAALDAYARMAGRYGVELRMPLRGVAEEEEMERLVEGWGEGERQRLCVLAGNYLEWGGGPDMRRALPALEGYIEEFLLPVTLAVMDSLLSGGEGFDPLEAAGRRLRDLEGG